MKEPCKGRYCEHLECFELENYLIFNENATPGETLKWKCPICKEITLWNELDIDLFAKEMMKEVAKQKKEGKFIVFDEFFYWEIHQGNEEYEELRTSNNLPKEKILLFSGNFYTKI